MSTFSFSQCYIKTVDQDELDFLLALRGTGITADLVFYTASTYSDDHAKLYDAHIKTYPHVLDDFIKRPEIAWQIVKLAEAQLDKLHAAGIIHADMHTGNVVVDWPKRDVRLIDFGASIWIKNDPNDNEIVAEMMYEGGPLTWADVMARDKKYLHDSLQERIDHPDD